MLLVKRLDAHAVIPAYSTTGSIGMDLSACFPDQSWTIIPPRTHALIKTGIALAIPNFCYGRVAPRSGLALKHGLDVLAGVIDSDYRGEIGVILMNNQDDPIRIDHGQRIAQLILERAEIMPVQEVTDLEETTRGDGGYGSTGL